MLAAFAKREMYVKEALEAEQMEKKKEKEMRMQSRQTAMANRSLAEQVMGQAQ